MPGPEAPHEGPFDLRRRLLEEAGWSPHAIVARRLPAAPDAVLAVGCGTGAFLEALAHVRDRVGVDPDPAAIAFARRHRTGPAFLVADAVIATSNAHGHLRGFWAALAEATRTHPRLAPRFQGTADGPPPEERLARTVRAVVPDARVEVVRDRIALRADAALGLLDTYREAFALGESEWGEARAAFDGWLRGRTSPGPWHVEVALAVVEAW